jgi:Fur family ferric uptake transcriptional regulator
VIVVDAQEHFSEFLSAKGIRRSTRRNEVLDVFLGCEYHITANQLVELVHQRNPKIGIATVYRTLKLITEAGIARAIEFGDGTMRYEHDYGHEHHDHIVCVQCGMFKEISNEGIEAEQVLMAQKLGFSLLRHKMVLYGVCPECSKKEKSL